MNKKCSNKIRMFYPSTYLQNTQYHVVFCIISDSSLGHRDICFKSCFISGNFETKIIGNAHVRFTEFVHA